MTSHLWITIESFFYINKELQAALDIQVFATRMKNPRVTITHSHKLHKHAKAKIESALTKNEYSVNNHCLDPLAYHVCLPIALFSAFSALSLAKCHLCLHGLLSTKVQLGWRSAIPDLARLSERHMLVSCANPAPHMLLHDMDHVFSGR